MGARNLLGTQIDIVDLGPNLIPVAMASRSSSRSRRESCTEKNFQCRVHEGVLVCVYISQNIRAISTGQLHTLRCFHPRPINVVVYHDSSPLRD